jgi:hypothetical protein
VGCYVLTNASGDVLYIGQAVEIRGRLEQHVESGKHRILTRYGYATVAWWSEVRAWTGLSPLERGWLQLCELADGERPPLNLIDAPT